MRCCASKHHPPSRSALLPAAHTHCNLAHLVHPADQHDALTIGTIQPRLLGRHKRRGLAVQRMPASQRQTACRGVGRQVGFALGCGTQGWGNVPGRLHACVSGKMHRSAAVPSERMRAHGTRHMQQPAAHWAAGGRQLKSRPPPAGQFEMPAANPQHRCAWQQRCPPCMHAQTESGGAAEERHARLQLHVHAWSPGVQMAWKASTAGHSAGRHPRRCLA